MKTKICLIRHGITEGNQKRLYYGSSDIPLAEEGVEVLRKLAAQGIYPDDTNAACYTSGMLRTEQTFSLIYGDREHEAFPPFREIDFGDFEMKSYRELKDDPDYQTWIADTTGTLPPPGGESALDFQARVLEGFAELLQRQEDRLENALQEETTNKPDDSDRSNTAGAPGQPRPLDDKLLTIVVCHGGPIAAILQKAFPDEKENFYQWLPDPGHGYLLMVEDGEIVGKESF